MPAVPTTTTPDPRRETVKLLYIQGLRPQEISRQTGVKVSTIGQWACRKGWSKIRQQSKQLLVKAGTNALLAETSATLKGVSERVRKTLAHELVGQVDALETVPVTYEGLGNTPAGEGRASVVKRIVETAAQVFDWDSQRASGLILAVDLAAPDGPGAVIDIAPEPAQLADTPQGETPQGT